MESINPLQEAVMSHSKTPMRTPGSVAVAVVVTLMFVTPVLAATTLHPVGFRWTALDSSGTKAAGHKDNPPSP